MSLNFLKDTAAERTADTRTFAVHTPLVIVDGVATAAPFNVTIFRATQKQEDAEAEQANERRSRGRTRFNRAKWAREFAKRIAGWENLTLEIFFDWLLVPVKPEKRQQVIDGFAANGGVLPYTAENAAYLVENADEERLVQPITRETDLWKEESGGSARDDDDRKSA